MATPTLIQPISKPTEVAKPQQRIGDIESDSENERSFQRPNNPRSLPKFDYLSVFIRVPYMPVYLYRKLYAKFAATGIPSAYDIGTLETGEFGRIPCHVHHLERALQTIVDFERRAGLNPSIKKVQAAVGKAEYKGVEPVRFNELVELTGIKYCMLKREWEAKKPNLQ